MDQEDLYPQEEQYPEEDQYPQEDDNQEEEDADNQDEEDIQAAEEDEQDEEGQYPQEDADEQEEEDQYPKEDDEAAAGDADASVDQDAGAEEEEEMAEEQPSDAEVANRDLDLYEGEEDAGAFDEEEVEAEEGVETHDITNPYYFRQEIQRIEQCETVLSRGLASMPKQELDDETRINLLDICADLEAEEDALFSPMPDCVATVLQKRRQLTEKKNRSVQPHEDCRRGASTAPSHFSEEQRAFVDPSVPLELPYSTYRFKKDHPEGSAGRGVYHDLFFGDGTQCQFIPPADNKRLQIEQEKAAHAIKRQPKPKYEPAPLRTMKVSKDFVPSCANVDNSEAQRKLRESQGPLAVKKRRTARS